VPRYPHYPRTAEGKRRFEEAQKWFHYIFDPTDDSEGPTPERFWKVRPFQTTDVERIEEILINLSTGADPELQQQTINSIVAWKESPFRPHVVARYRQPAYMFKTVMAYLDNLIAWGDSLFRQDTGEAIDSDVWPGPGQTPPFSRAGHRCRRSCRGTSACVNRSQETQA